MKCRARTSLSNALTFLILRPLMRAWYVFVVLELPSMPQPADDPQAQMDGINAQRVLLFGCGLVEGFGVLSHQIALSGRIAMELGGATGRGVNVELEVHRRRWIASASRAIDSMDAQPFDAVIVSIGAGEALTLMPPLQWDRKMKSLLVAITQSNGDGQVVIAGIQPFCSLSGSLLGIAEAHARKLNNVTRLLCSELPNVHFVSLPRSNPLNERRTAVMYLQWAKLITRELAPRISGIVKKQTSLPAPTAPIPSPLDVVSVLPPERERLSAVFDPRGGKDSPDRLAP